MTIIEWLTRKSSKIENIFFPRLRFSPSKMLVGILARYQAISRTKTPPNALKKLWPLLV